MGHSRAPHATDGKELGGSHLTPLGWGHINLTGDYSWRQNKQVEQGDVRRLPPLSGLVQALAPKPVESPLSGVIECDKFVYQIERVFEVRYFISVCFHCFTKQVGEYSHVLAGSNFDAVR